MGQYLECGIAQRIIIENRDKEDNKEILDRIKQNIDLNLYNIDEDDEYIELEMKEDMFEKYAVDFVIEQSNFFSDSEKTYVENVKTLKGLKYEELINIAKEKSIYNFQFLDGNSICCDISYLDPKHRCTIYCDFIRFIGDGKVFLECYYDIFTYLRNCIVNASNNPIRTSAIITIYG